MEYEESLYQAPQVLESLGSILRRPREVFSSHFASAFSDDITIQRSYARGILAVGSFFVALLFIWIFVLVVLKIKGKEVGCASGRAFQMPKSDDDDLQATDSSSGGYSMNDDESSSLPSRYDMEGVRQEADLSDYGSEDSDSAVQSEGSWTELEREQPVTQTSKRKSNLRERNTRGCFLFSSIISLCLVPFILVFSFGPMKEATNSSQQLVLLAQEAIDSATLSFDMVKDATASSQAVLATMPHDLGVICPLMSQGSMEAELGVDLAVLHDTVTEGFEATTDLVEQRLSFFYNSMVQMRNGSIAFEDHVQEAESYMWIVPGLLFTVSILCAFAVLASVLAWKQKSEERIEFASSYLVLPALILASIGCWTAAVLASAGTMMTSDICIPESTPPLPETTIQEILIMRHRDGNDTVYQFVDFYTNGCKGSLDPIDYISDLERRVQGIVDEIWRQISIIDSIGRAKILTDCGGDYLVDFVSGARNVAKLLTTMRRSLRDASGHLECDKLNPLYTQLIHNTLCTDAASASSYGFIFFLILSISTMVMVSLRAALLQNTGEDEKVYQDEDEIAENMVVDEHEDYLKYISKYKHEWQEYNGIETPGSSAVARRHPYLERKNSVSSLQLEALQSAREFGSPGGAGAGMYDQNGGALYDYYGGQRTDGEGYQGSDEFSEVSSPTSDQDELSVGSYPTSMDEMPYRNRSLDHDISRPSLQTIAKSLESVSPKNGVVLASTTRRPDDSGK